MGRARALFGGDAGADEVLYASGLVEGYQRPIASVRQRTSAVDDPLEHRVEVEALVDAEAGRTELGEPVEQRRTLVLEPVG